VSIAGYNGQKTAKSRRKNHRQNIKVLEKQIFAVSVELFENEWP